MSSCYFIYTILLICFAVIVLPRLMAHSIVEHCVCSKHVLNCIKEHLGSQVDKVYSPEATNQGELKASRRHEHERHEDNDATHIVRVQVTIVKHSREA